MVQEDCVPDKEMAQCKKDQSLSQSPAARAG